MGAMRIAGFAEEQPVTVDGQVAMMDSRHRDSSEPQGDSHTPD